MDREDRERLWEAISAHRPRLLRIARARTASRDDAEDCVHEAMLRCVEFENLDESRLGQLLTTATIRLCADRHRATLYGERLHQRLAGRRADVEPSPEEDACDRAEASWLAQRVLQLPQRQQEVVRARASGMSCAEVAERMRMSYTAVESQIARARSAIRATLASSLGVIVPPGRWKWFAAATGGASVSAIAVLVLPHLLAPAPSPAHYVDAHRVQVPPASVRDVAVTAEPPAPAPQAQPAPDAVVVQPRPPGDRSPGQPEPWVSTPAGQVGPDEKDDDYTTTERLGHCLSLGIEIDPFGRTGCRYPTEQGRGHERNDRERDVSGDRARLVDRDPRIGR